MRLDLIPAPYVLYGVEYIDLVSLGVLPLPIVVRQHAGQVITH